MLEFYQNTEEGSIQRRTVLTFGAVTIGLVGSLALVAATQNGFVNAGFGKRGSRLSHAEALSLGLRESLPSRR